MRNAFRFSLIAATLLTAVPGLLRAQSQEFSVEQLTHMADVVAVGKVASLNSGWTGDHSRIVTQVKLSVQQYLKGSGAGGTITISVPGGEVDGVGELYTHTAAFKQDEEVVVFGTLDANGTLRVAGGQSGKIPITRDPATGRRVVNEVQPLDALATIVKNTVNAQAH